MSKYFNQHQITLHIQVQYCQRQQWEHVTFVDNIIVHQPVAGSIVTTNHWLKGMIIEVYTFL